MKILIVGGSSSGLFLALDLKMNNKDAEVIVLEKNSILGKKIYATGNGRCNLGNTSINDFSYNNEETFAVYKKFNVKKQKEYFEKIGLKLTKNNNLIYPFSYSAKQFSDRLIALVELKGVKVLLNEKFKDYSIFGNKVIVNSNKQKFLVDKIVFAVGGKSNSKLGSDGNLINLFKEHKYKLNELLPGLAPFKVKENVSQIENEKVKVLVFLFSGNEEIYKESGEVLFKKDGLSGIVSFNVNSIILRKKLKKAKIYLDLFENEKEEDLITNFNELNSLYGTSFLDGIFSIKMKNYIVSTTNVKSLYKYNLSEIKKIVQFVKKMPFSYVSSYDFDSSQVTIGGISYSNLNEDLSSKIEKHVYFIGEVIDADGLCGGYNLMFAFASAKVVSEAIKKTL